MKYIVTHSTTQFVTTKTAITSKANDTDRIAQLNKLFDEGNEIHYWTARGGNSGLDWTELTHKQLSEWGLNFFVQMKKSCI